MIALFSATGNSRLVAENLAARLGGETIKPLLTLRQSDVDGERRIIWIFPVHGWGVLPVVRDSIERLTLSPTITNYLVLTCGDDIGHTDRHFSELIESRGGKLQGAFSVRMPNTYVIFPGMDTDPVDVERKKLTDAPSRIAVIAEAIDGNKSVTDVIPGALASLKSGLIRRLFLRYLMSPKPFHVIERDCKRCGACSRACPLGNITMSVERLPQWGMKCATCLACYHRCPAHAVAYGKITARKGQYRAPDNLLD